MADHDEDFMSGAREGYTEMKHFLEELTSLQASEPDLDICLGCAAFGNVAGSIAYIVEMRPDDKTIEETLALVLANAEKVIDMRKAEKSPRH